MDSSHASRASRGIAQGFLSEIEAGRKSGDVKTLRKLADLLKISLERSRRARSVKPETAIEEGRRPVIAPLLGRRELLERE